MVLLYYAALSLIRPYFTPFMEEKPFGLTRLEAGGLVVLPAAVCMATALFYQRLKLDQNLPGVMILATVIMVISTGMQVLGQSLAVVVLGRVAYGVALFLVQMGIDLLLFRNSRSDALAWNYRLIAIAMNMALIIAPFTLGYVVAFGGLSMPFYVSMATSGVLLLSLIFLFSSRHDKQNVP
ncbi:MAG: hypothetical protein P8Y45_14650 [Exilibacterium sp.]